ncbi:MAG TPA: hypothetical protein VHE81_10340 [Lacipirellulaceae bacterium]|nr:hypothetical protein [Lacipirellulaceae bacterium]
MRGIDREGPDHTFNAFSVIGGMVTDYPACAALAATLGFGVKRLRRTSHHAGTWTYSTKLVG